MIDQARAFLGLGVAVSVLLCAPLKAQISDNPGAYDGPDPAVVNLADGVVDSANAWLRWYGRLPPVWRRVLERPAVAVASIRRHELQYLIINAPERALEDTLGRVDRVALPAKVVTLLEEQIDGRGQYQVGISHSTDPKTGEIIGDKMFRYVMVGQQRFWDPSIYGRRLLQISADDLPIHGIALQGHFAWSEAPYRILDAVELDEHQVPLDHIGLLVGDDVKIFPIDDDSLVPYIAGLISRESLLIAINNLVRYLWGNGDKRVLWLPVDFAEAPGSRFEQSPGTDAMIADANDWLDAISRGRTALVATYFPGGVLRLPPGTLADAAATTGHPDPVVGGVEEALAAYDAAHGGTGQWLPTSWDRIIVVVSDALIASHGAGSFTSTLPVARISVFHGQPANFSGLLKHELGHTYGLWHPLFLRSGTPDPLGPGTLQLAWWDFMGEARGADNRNHPSAFSKLVPGWLDASEIANGSSGGSFRIVAHDDGPAGSTRLIRIVAGDRIYLVDMRRLWPDEPILQAGVQIHFAPAEGWNRHQGTLVAPRGDTSIQESPFVAGEMLEDTARGVRIRVDATGMDGSTPVADVTVERF